MHLGEMRAGARAVAPMLVGVVPFGLVAGASPAEKGLGTGAPSGSPRSCSPARPSSRRSTCSATVARRSSPPSRRGRSTCGCCCTRRSLAPHLAAESLADPARRRLPPDRPGLCRVDHAVGRNRRPEAPGAVLPRCRPHAVGQLAAVHDHRRRHRPVGARGRAPRVRRAAGVPRAAHPCAQRPARASSPRPSAGSAPCSPPSSAWDRCRSWWARWPGSRPAPSPTPAAPPSSRRRCSTSPPSPSTEHDHGSHDPTSSEP